MAADTLEIRFTLNGDEREVVIPARMSALALLRDQLGCTSVKAGCSPQGVCGSCAAVVGGKARLTCTLPAKTLNGKEVLTHGGLDPQQAELIGRAFAAAGLAQSGYEVPGMVMSLVALRQAAGGAPLDAAMVRKALQVHSARNFGYGAVIAAFLLADRMLRGEADRNHRNDRNDRSTVPQALAQAALGQRTSVDDLVRPGMLHAALVLVPQAPCRLDQLDTSAALELSGVVQVLTAADLPASPRHGVCKADAPVLLGLGQTAHSSSCVVALVLADTVGHARLGAAAVVLGTTGSQALDNAESATPGNATEPLLYRTTTTRGDAQAALLAAAHRASIHTSTAGGDPLFVEPEAALAVPLEDGRVHIYGAGQDLFRDLEQLASISGLDPDDIELEHLPVGGAFGGRLDLTVTGLALIAAQATGRPVKLSLQLAEGARLHAGRHPTDTQLELGCDDQGRLQALRGTVVLDAGGYTGASPIVADTIARNAAMAYDVQHVDLVVKVRCTGGPESGASLGLGLPAYNLAVEGALDLLAEQLQMAGIELRSRNLLAPGDVTASGVAVPASWDPGPSVAALAAELPRLKDADCTIGVAFGAQLQGVVGDSAVAELVVQGPAHVQIITGFSESGQGFNTRASALSARITGLHVDCFQLLTSTACDVPCGPTLAGRDRRLGLPAVNAAAQRLAAALATADGDLSTLVGQHFVGEAQADPVIGFTAQAAAIGPDGALAELVVAVTTGNADDSVHTIGWLAAAAQQGLELAITAERQVTAGIPETRWTKLGVLKARHVPPITIRALMGGPALPLEDTVITGTPAAVASALRAVGQPQTHLPAKGTTVARKMGVRPPRT